MMEFDIPLALRDLEAPQRDAALGVTQKLDVAGMTDGEANELVERVAYDLCENDATCILEQEVFDQAYACVRDFTALAPMGRIRLADALCSNLSVLTASAASLMASGQGDAMGGAETVAAHREALKAYAALIYWIADAADAEAASCAAPSVTGEKAAQKKAAKGKKAAPLIEWKWEEQRERVMHTMSGVLDADLWNLFRPRQPSEAFLGLFVRLACLAMESQPALRSKITRGASFDMLGACALKWGQLDTVVTALVHLLNKHEHLPGPIAECVAVAADRHENARLAAALLSEVGRVDPAEYKRQQLSDAVGVRCVGTFVAELAERMPKTTMTNISLLLPHLDGEAYSLRSALVTVLGHLLCSEACSGTAIGGADRDRSTSEGAAPLLRAKQGFLDLLVERVHDVSAFTRARVLQTWATMAEKKAIPLSHWLVVADLGIGRLNDKAALVRKAAMGLLATMLGFNPFAPQLPSAAFAESLKNYEAKLKAMGVSDDEEDAGDDTIEEGDEEAALAGPPSPSQVPLEDDTQPSQAPIDQSDGAEGADDGHREAPELDGGIEAVRTMIAALKTALGFAVQMTGAVGVLSRLLASSTPSDQIEAAGTLVRLYQFGVDGANEGVRRMLGLVFSRDQGVRDAVVEAVDVLFLAGADSPVAAAAALANVAAESALGELAALEEIIKLLVTADRMPLNGAVMRALWAAALSGLREPCGDVEPEADAPMRAAALTVLAMAAAQHPESVAPHIDRVAAVLDAAAGGASRRGDEKKKSQSRPAPTLARAAACLLSRARPGGNAGTPTSAGVATPALALDSPAFVALSRVLSPDAVLPGRSWYPAAEQSLAALYALHPDPEGAAADILRSFASAAFGGSTAAEGGLARVHAGRLSRFLFVLGEVGLRQLVHVEALARAVRRARVARDRRAAEASEAAAARGDVDGEEAELAAALGQGSVAEDTNLDNARETAEAELLSFSTSAKRSATVGKGFVAAYAPVVVALCGHPAVATGHPLLRGAALAALSRLMAIDAGFCEEHLALIFTRLRGEPDKDTRSALMVALGDLAFRFPNAVEPWTEHLYGLRAWGNSLHDADAGVRQHAITVLAHLVLNDMMKVKGHIAEMARCLEDPDPRVASVARLLFTELSRKHGNPIYNLLPDLLSRLSGDETVSPPAFQRIMTRLLSFIDKDRQTEALADKFTARFAEAALASSAKPARDVAFCLSQLALSDKAFKKFVESWKLYEPALYDKEVYASLSAVVAKAKKSCGGGKKDKEAGAGDTAKQAVEEFEAKMAAAHAERYESYRSARRAEGHPVDDDEEVAEEAADEEEADEEHPLGPLKASADVEMGDADVEMSEADVEEEDVGGDENNPVPVVRGGKTAPAARKVTAVSEPKTKSELVEQDTNTGTVRRSTRAR